MYLAYQTKHLKVLKNLLQSKYLYFGLFIFLFCYVFLFTKVIKYESIYNDGNISIEAVVVNYKKYENRVVYFMKAEEVVKATYYYEENNPDIKIGDKVLITGKASTPLNNTIPNTFNNKKYLYNQKIYKEIIIEKYKIINKSTNIMSNIKNHFYRITDNNAYLRLFIIGDKSLLDSEMYNNYKDSGVAHLLAISGMHVSVFILILSKMLFFVSDNKKNVIISIFLIIYSYIVNFTSSILRVVLFFMLTQLNKYLNINISKMNILFLTVFILIIFNPFIIYQIGFLYSFITAFSIIFNQKYFSESYYKNILIITFFATLYTLPITINLNYEINLITFVSNFIFVPLVSFIVYPLSLLTLILPFITPVFNTVTMFMELIIRTINQITIFNIIIPKLSFFVVIIYYFLLISYSYYNLKRYLIILIITILSIKYLVLLDSNYYVYYLDVGQGDTSIIIYPYKKKIVMLDTGGIPSYSKSNFKISDNIILFLKSKGIIKVDYLILSHGDYDHMGDSINFVNNFKVENAFLNNDTFNELELKLINVLNKKNISYYNNINYINENIIFLNNEVFDNENDNSIVTFINLKGYKLLFMGDAGIKTENSIIQKYNLQNIDILKVGHHGSDSSSGKNFIDFINPKYSIISVGRNNRYGHPKETVLNNLKNTTIYRTDKEGSIMFKIKNNIIIKKYNP